MSHDLCLKQGEVCISYVRLAVPYDRLGSYYGSTIPTTHITVNTRSECNSTLFWLQVPIFAP